MRTKTLLTITMATLLVAGCAPWARNGERVRPAAADPRIKCEASHPVCYITVRVRNCRVEVDPDWKRVAFRPGGVQMLWTLADSKGVSFAPNGIAFKRPFEDAKGAIFTPDRSVEAGSTFAMRNSTTPGKFEYTVNVVENGRICAPHDPGVVNEM